MIKNGIVGLTAAAVIALFGSAAQATPVTTPPAPVTADGNVKLVYIGGDAGDKSYLSLLGGPSKIFCNHGIGSCAAAASGTVADLGTLSGPLVFTLKDTTVVNLFDTQTMASDGAYHAKIVSHYADLGIFAEPSGMDALIASLAGSEGTVSYIGFEDRLRGDYDYNDFVFAVINTPVPKNPVPEPASLSLLGAGLLGLGRLRRRRKASNG